MPGWSHAKARRAERKTTVNDIHPTRWRTLWLSDIHLGTSGCKAQFLLDFLDHNDADTLYLVGDIVDGWQLRKHWHWPRAHNDVVQRILRKARSGTRVVFIPGNHDEFAREFIGYAFGDIEILDEEVHVTAKGQKLLVLHGDQFDGVIQHSKWLAHLGDSLYQFALWLNNHYMRSLDPAYVAKHLEWHMAAQNIDTSKGPALAEVVTLLAERCNTLVEMAAQSRYLFEDFEAIDEAAAKKHLRGVAAEPLTLAKAKLAALETWTTEALHELIEATAAELGQGMGKVGMPLRVAVTGLGQSPGIDAVMALVGKERVLARIDRALAYIEARMAAE